jgi:serine/threonine-protein kinase RsbW
MVVLNVTNFRAAYPSAYRSVAEARRAVGVFAKSCGFAMPDISDIVLAVGEACSNAVEHGHVERARFVVTCDFADPVLRIEVRDTGAGFGTETPLGCGALSEFVGRGRGIQIMRALMDAVTYRCNGSGTTAVLEKRLSACGVEKASGESYGIDSRGSG